MSSAPLLVLDTNIVLDIFMFRDKATLEIEHALLGGRARCITDATCVEELRRVAAYPQFALEPQQSQALLRDYLALAELHTTGPGVARDLPKLPTCRDPDDQKFLELAQAARADLLVTKDRALLKLARPCSRAQAFRIVAPAAATQALRDCAPAIGTTTP